MRDQPRSSGIPGRMQEDKMSNATEPQSRVGLCSTADAPAEGAHGFAARAVALNGTRWDLGSTLTVQFLEGNSDLQNLVETHSREWEPLSGLKLKFLGPGDNQPSQVRVAFSPAFGVSVGEFNSNIGNQARLVPQS